MSRAPAVSMICAALLLSGCVAAMGGERPKGEDDTTLEQLSVGSGAGGGSCSTSIVRGLVEQLVAETNCLRPGVYERIDDIPGLSMSAGAAAAPYLHQEAAAALRRAVSGGSIRINSGLRTLPQQYLLRQWAERGRCRIRAAARPGRSNHESGLAIDVSDAGWRNRLEAHGFDWFGSGDPPHYDFEGGEDLRSLSVKAFQRLWNRNHPEDRIAEDGLYGPATEARLRRAPAEGFPTGARCDSPSDPAPTDPAPTDPEPTDPEPSDPEPTDPAPTSPCDAGHGTSCASCNAIATGCGWCASAGRCMEGNALGPISGSCATDWQWVSPSSCPDTTTPEPSDPEPSDPPPPEPAPMCSPLGSSCSPGECCSGLDCRRGVSFGVRCCGASGTMCDSGGDCCGYMDCVSGRCTCRRAGRACLEGGDCCSGTCSGGACR